MKREKGSILKGVHRLGGLLFLLIRVCETLIQAMRIVTSNQEQRRHALSHWAQSDIHFHEFRKCQFDMKMKG